MKHLISCGLLTATAGLLMLAACGDDSTTNNFDNTAIESFTQKSLPECTGENQGMLAFVKTDSTLRVCYDAEWFVLNGKPGQKGNPGDPGEQGDPGKPGAQGQVGDDGTGCTVTTLKDSTGLKLVCDGDSIGVIKHGKQGDPGNPGESGDDCVPCKTETLKDSSGYKIVCGEDSVAVVLNGKTMNNVSPLSSSSKNVAPLSSSAKNTTPASSSSNGVPVEPASSSSNGVPVEPASSSNEVPPVVGESSSSEEKKLCPTDPVSPSGYSADNFPEAYGNVLNTSGFSKKPNEGSVKPVEGSIKPIEEKPTIYLIDLNYSISCTPTTTSAYLTNTWYYAIEISDVTLVQNFVETLVKNLKDDGLDSKDPTIEEGKIVYDFSDRKKGVSAEIVAYSSGEITLLFSYRESLSATTGGSTSGEGI